MITDKMIPAFKEAEGGLFSNVEKADVGDFATRMNEMGVSFLSWADPFRERQTMPVHVAQAIIESMKSGVAEHYTMPIGMPELKCAIAAKLRRVNGLDVAADRNIIVTPGSDGALFFSMLPFIAAGDEVMIVDPSYPNNAQNARILGGTVVSIPVYAQNGYQFDIRDFEEKLTPRTKMVVLTNPNNPTTVSYRRDRMEALAQFIVKNDLVLVVDQAFEEPVFDGIEMVTAAALPGMWERTLTVFSVSKGMGLSGLRVGYIVADDRIMDKLYATIVTVLGTANTSAQIGALAAFEDDSFMEAYFASFDKRRKLVFAYLHDIPGVSMFPPESGFLSWVDVSALGSESEVADYLIADAKVAVNVGTPYGAQGKGHIRIAHGSTSTDEELEMILKRMRASLLKLGKARGITV